MQQKCHVRGLIKVNAPDLERWLIPGIDPDPGDCVMSDKTQNDPFNVLGISKEFLAAAKLPYGGAMFTDMA